MLTIEEILVAEQLISHCAACPSDEEILFGLPESWANLDRATEMIRIFQENRDRLDNISLHYRGPFQETLLHHLGEHASQHVIQAYLGFLQPTVLNALIISEDSNQRTPLYAITKRFLYSSLLQFIFEKATPALCSQGLTASHVNGRTPLDYCKNSSHYEQQSAFEFLTDHEPREQEIILATQLMNLVLPEHFQALIENTELLGTLSDFYLDLLKHVDVKIIKQVLLKTSLRAIRLDRFALQDNVHTTSTPRVVALETLTLQAFNAIINKGVSLEIIYQNLFIISKEKPLRNGKKTSTTKDPFNIHINDELNDILIAKICGMEIDWLYGNPIYDMRDILLYKQKFSPQSEQARKEQLTTYRAFSDYCKFQKPYWQEKLNHLIAAAEANVYGARQMLMEYHTEEVKELEQALKNQKTEAAAIKTLQRFSELEDTRADTVLKNHYQDKVDQLLQLANETGEYKELEKLAKIIPRAEKALAQCFMFHAQKPDDKKFKELAFNYFTEKLLKQCATLPDKEVIRRFRDLSTKDDTLNKVALYRGEYQETFLHHLAEHANASVIQGYLECIHSNILDSLIIMEDKYQQTPLYTIARRFSYSDLLKFIFTRASRENCSQALTASQLNGRAPLIGKAYYKDDKENVEQQSAFEFLTDHEPRENAVPLATQLMSIVLPQHFAKLIQQTEILGNLSTFYLDLLKPVDVKIIEQALLKTSSRKIRITLSDIHEDEDFVPAICRVVALETLPLRIFEAIINKGVSLEIIYQNIFLITKYKLSTNVHKAHPAVPLTGVITAMENAIGTYGMNWSIVPYFAHPEIIDILLLKLSAMELEWLNGNERYDMKKILLYKQKFFPDTEKSKQDQIITYRLFRDYCKSQQPNWQEKLKHFIAAAQANVYGARQMLMEYHADEVIELKQALSESNTETAAIKTLREFSELGDTNAEDVLKNYYHKKIDQLFGETIKTGEYKDLQELAKSMPNAALALGKYFVFRGQKPGEERFKKIAIDLFLRFNHPPCHFELGNCYIQGNITEKNVKKGLSLYYELAIKGYLPAKNAIEQFAEITTSEPTEETVYANILLALANNDFTTPSLHTALNLAPDVFTNLVMEHEPLRRLAHNVRGYGEVSDDYDCVNDGTKYAALKHFIIEHCPEQANYNRDRAMNDKNSTETMNYIRYRLSQPSPPLSQFSSPISFPPARYVQSPRPLFYSRNEMKIVTRPRREQIMPAGLVLFADSAVTPVPPVASVTQNPTQQPILPGTPVDEAEYESEDEGTYRLN